MTDKRAEARCRNGYGTCAWCCRARLGTAGATGVPSGAATTTRNRSERIDYDRADFESSVTSVTRVILREGAAGSPDGRNASVEPIGFVIRARCEEQRVDALVQEAVAERESPQAVDHNRTTVDVH